MMVGLSASGLAPDSGEGMPLQCALLRARLPPQPKIQPFGEVSEELRGFAKLPVLGAKLAEFVFHGPKLLLTAAWAADHIAARFNQLGIRHGKC
jgi:hypothetical protein